MKGPLPAILFLSCAAWTAALPVHAAELHAAVAIEDITPPAGFRLSGYFHERLATGTRDPLHAKALVLIQGEAKAAFVLCDLIGMAREVTDRVRARAAAKTGIPAEAIAIAATHSHTGPLYFDALRDHFHELAVELRGRDPHEAVDYPKLLEDRLVGAIERAHAAVKPVRLAAAAVEQKPQLGYNRRFHMKDGTVRFNPGQRNPDIIRPAGPIDPEVGVIFFEEPSSGKAFASLTVFAMHLDTLGGTEYSADYPFYLERELRKGHGEGFVSLFGAGTCGDLNHIDVSRPDRRSTEEIGTLLAATVKAAFDARSAQDAPSLAARRARVEVKLQRHDNAQVAKAREAITKIGTNEIPFLEQVKACAVLDVVRMGGPTLPVEVQAFRLSKEVAIVALPGEVFVELGLAIKRASPFRRTLVIELANDDIAYVPTTKAFAEGSYETVNSRIEPGEGELLVEAALRLLVDLAK